MATNYLDEELKRVAPAPKTELQQRTKEKAAEYGRGFVRNLNPFRSGDAQKNLAGRGYPAVGTAAAHAPSNLETPQQPGAPVPVLSGQSKVAVDQPGQERPGQQQSGPQPTVKDGWTSTTDQSVYGGQVLSMNPGQEGGGWGYQSGPARGNLGMNSVARQNLQGRGQVGGYSFEGRGADFARFAQQPTRPAGWDGNTVASQPAAYLGVRDRYDANRAAQDQLAGLDPRSGWGWKGRQDLYKHQQGLDQRDREVGTRAMMDAAQLQAGQQQAAAALAQGDRQFNAEQQGRDVDMQAKQLEIQSEQKRQEIIKQLDTTTDPNERRALQGQLLAMQGKDPAQKYQVVTREGFDPVTNMPTKTPYAVNQDDPTQSFEIRGEGGQQQQPTPAPQAALDYLKKNPGQAAAFKEKYGYLPAGG